MLKLDPQPGEETELAERRAAMMRAEKIATDIAAAQDVLSGPASPVPQLASLLRRLQRKAADVPGLLDEIIKGVDGGLISLDAAQAAVEAAMRASEFDPQLLDSTEERLFAPRPGCAAPAARPDGRPRSVAGFRSGPFAGRRSEKTGCRRRRWR